MPHLLRELEWRRLETKRQSESQVRETEPGSEQCLGGQVVVGTNIAEASITIPDVVHVIDTGRVKEMRLDTDRNMSCLKVSILRIVAPRHSL